jgi:hypothetical protein
VTPVRRSVDAGGSARSAIGRRGSSDTSERSYPLAHEPYTTDEVVRAKTGVDWPAQKLTGIGSRDDVIVAVFLEAGHVSTYAVVSRSAADIDGELGPLARSDVLTIAVMADGRRIISVAS